MKFSDQFHYSICAIADFGYINCVKSNTEVPHWGHILSFLAYEQYLMHNLCL